MGTKRIFLLLSVLAAVLGASAAWGADAIRGKIAYPAGVVLPPTAVVHVQLTDDFAADAPVVAAHTVLAANPPPEKFVLKLDPRRVQGHHPYSLTVSVRANGQYLLYAPEKYRVLTMGNPVSVTVGLAPVKVPPKERPYWPGIAETYWRLIHAGGVPVAAGFDREPHILLNDFAKSVTGSGGCNILRGAFELSGQSVSFQDVVSTRMRCPKATNSDARLVQALEAARGWKIAGDRMELVDEKGSVLAAFQGIPPEPAIPMQR